VNEINKKKTRAIIDIGSNSIRLVIYGGAPRAPIALYNEKFSAGLGRAVLTNGELDAEAKAGALKALARFATLVERMPVDSLQVAATAAVRDASNGAEFLQEIKALGLPVELLSGQEEAIAAGYGVISALPFADGIAVDLGGGSMELVRISGGKVHEAISLRLGILRVADIAASGENKLRKYVQKLVSDIPWLWNANDIPLYLVGGSWRALARVHLHITQAPLPVIGNHIIPRTQVHSLVDAATTMSKDELKAIPSMPSSRIAMLADSAALLSALQDIISPSEMIVCAFGLREGLLFQQLGKSQRSEDPLIAGARFAAQQSERFGGYGDAMAVWLDQLFPGEKAAMLRLRHAACVLADLGWSSNPEFRALSGEELALHGTWVGVTAKDRAILAAALYASFGGDQSDLGSFLPLVDQDVAERARIWGLAIRLGHRLSAGAAEILAQCSLRIRDNKLRLTIPKDMQALDSSSVRGRLSRLAKALDLPCDVVFD
jgi:exopolyphosphatase / guanosine-5'-triphosphate,3'-diphosphate pyrophosphatase